MSAFDPHASFASKLMLVNPAAYSEVVVSGGTPTESRSLLKDVTPRQLIDGEVRSWPAASAALGAIWLWHDGLEECHGIVQKTPDELEKAALNLRRNPLEMYKNRPSAPSVEGGKAVSGKSLQAMTETLAFWHAILHRREGDFSNAKYWFRRIGEHPTLPALAARVDTLIQQLPADKSLFKLTAGGVWNGPAFVDLVEAVHRDVNDARRKTVIELQRLEWRTLFETTLREAAG